MGQDSSIEWTDKTWNPTTGCTKVTAGCTHCYAETIHRRFHQRLYGEPFVPWTVKAQQDARPEDMYLGSKAVRLHPERLDQPLRWRQPKECVCGHRHLRLHSSEGGTVEMLGCPDCPCDEYRQGRLRIFVDSMSDLFHEDIPDEFIARVFAAMSQAPQHIFQVLTKRPERALDWFAGRYGGAMQIGLMASEFAEDGQAWTLADWPLPNVWIGVSVTGGKETAPFLDALSRIPAAVRFVSYEPALRGFDFTHVDYGEKLNATLRDFKEWAEMTPVDLQPNEVVSPGVAWLNYLTGEWFDGWDSGSDGPRIDWLILGCESGPKARTLPWECVHVVGQCRAAGVPVFVKQLPHPDGKRGHVSTNPDDWPEALRVRELPEVVLK